MRKKVIAMFMATTLALSVGVPTWTQPMLVNAEEVQSGDWTYEVNDTGNVTITGYEGSDVDVTIPAEIDGKSVTSIGESAFYECSNLISIMIPDSVTNIGKYAFMDCNSLTNITIPESVTSFGAWAFWGTPWLSEKRLEDEYVVVNDSLIDAMKVKDTVINIPDTVTHIGGAAFEACSNIISITIPNTVTSIGEYAFVDCSSLTDINIPNSVMDIGEYAFANCESLTSISIPDSVTSIRKYAFSGCESLTDISIPNSITNIEQGAFTYHSLTDIIIPNSVTTIGKTAFAYSPSLKSVTIPSSVTNIGVGAFGSSPNLSSITILGSVTSIEMGAFLGCAEDFTIYGVKGSLAETYALDNEYSFVEISIVEESTTEIQETTEEESTTEIQETTEEESTTEIQEITEEESTTNVQETTEEESTTEIQETTEAVTTKTEIGTITQETTTVMQEEMIITNTVSGVTVSGVNLPSDAQITVDMKQDKSDRVVSVAMETLGCIEYVSFDIKLLNKSEEVIQPNGIVTVNIEIPEKFANVSNLAIYYVADDGKATKLNSSVKDGYINFETDHFSKYVMVKEKETETEEVVTSQTEEKTSEEIETSNTGDSTPIFTFILLSFISVGVLFNKKYYVN